MYVTRYKNPTVNRRYNEGKCTYCGVSEPMEGRPRCSKCQDMLKMIRKEYRKDHRALGLCLSCTSPAVKGYTLCQFHRDKHRNNGKTENYVPNRVRKSRRLMQVCTQCGIYEPEFNRMMCKECIHEYHLSKI